LNTVAVLRQLFAAFPNTEASTETVAMYVKLLGDIPPLDLQVIVDQAVSTARFLPTIGELREMHHNLRHIGQLSWVEAWGAVGAEMRRIGSYGVPHFEDELTARVVKMMGWRTLCASEQPSIDRAQFRDMYTALASREEREQKLLPHTREWAERNGGLLPLRNLLDLAQLKANQSDNQEES